MGEKKEENERKCETQWTRHVKRGERGSWLWLRGEVTCVGSAREVKTHQEARDSTSNEIQNFHIVIFFYSHSHKRRRRQLEQPDNKNYIFYYYYPFFPNLIFSFQLLFLYKNIRYTNWVGLGWSHFLDQLEAWLPK